MSIYEQLECEIES